MKDLFTCIIREIDPPDGLIDMAIDIIFNKHEKPYSTIYLNSNDTERAVKAMQLIQFSLYDLNFMASKIISIGGSIS